MNKTFNHIHVSSENHEENSEGHDLDLHVSHPM